MFKSYQKNNQSSSPGKNSTLSGSQNSFYKKKNLPDLSPSEKSDENGSRGRKESFPIGDNIQIRVANEIYDDQPQNKKEDRNLNFNNNTRPINENVFDHNYESFKAKKGPFENSLLVSENKTETPSKFQFKTTPIEIKNDIKSQKYSNNQFGTTGFEFSPKTFEFIPTSNSSNKLDFAQTAPVLQKPATSNQFLGKLSNLQQFMNVPNSEASSSRMINYKPVGNLNDYSNNKYPNVSRSSRGIDNINQNNQHLQKNYLNPTTYKTKEDNMYGFTRGSEIISKNLKQPSYLYREKEEESYQKKGKNDSERSKSDRNSSERKNDHKTKQSNRNYENDVDFDDKKHHNKKRTTKKREDEYSSSEEKEKTKKKSKRQDDYLNFIQPDEYKKIPKANLLNPSNIAELMYIFLGRVEMLRLSEKNKHKIFEPTHGEVLNENRALKKEIDGLRQKLETIEAERAYLNNLKIEKEQIQLMLDKTTIEYSKARGDIYALKVELDNVTNNKNKHGQSFGDGRDKNDNSNEIQAKINEIARLQEDLRRACEFEVLLKKEAFRNDKLTAQVDTLQALLSEKDKSISGLNELISKVKNENQHIFSEVFTFLGKVGIRSNIDGLQPESYHLLDMFRNYNSNLRVVKTDNVDARPPSSASKREQQYVTPAFQPDYSNVQRENNQYFNNSETISLNNTVDKVSVGNFTNRSPSPSNTQRVFADFENIKQSTTSHRTQNLKTELKKLKQKVLHLEEKAHETRI